MLTSRRKWLRRSLALDAVIVALEAPGLTPARRTVLLAFKARLEPAGHDPHALPGSPTRRSIAPLAQYQGRN